LHLAIYESRADISAVIHTHPPAATAFAVAHRAPDDAILAEAATLLGGVALVRYQEPGSDALGRSVADALRAANALLLVQHGAVTGGHSIDDALQRMELLEKLCEIQIRADLLGGAQTLSGIEIAALQRSAS